MSEKSVRVNHIIPYNSGANRSTADTDSTDNADWVFNRKENPRLVRFVAGSGRKTKKKTRGMR